MKKILNRSETLDLEKSLKCEYLLANSYGGYASSSILDCHRRRYHGLLVVPVEEYGKMFNLLSKLEVSFTVNKKEFLLSTNKFPGVYHPTGHKYIERFEMGLYPITYYHIGDVEITKSIIMSHNSNTVLIRYDVVKSEKPLLLKAVPLLAYREIHDLMKENIYIQQRSFFEKNGFKIEPYKGLPPLYVQTSRNSTFFPSPCWWYGFEYIKERNRGYPYQEDLFSPGVFETHLKQGGTVIFRASTKCATGQIKQEWDNEIRKLNKRQEKYSDEAEPCQQLLISSEAYLTKNTKGDYSIKAGYHWFEEWGRDTMISLTGLALCTGKKEVAFNILSKYAQYEKDGLLPNFIAERNKLSYNSIDSALLYFWAIQNYIAFGGEKKKVKNHLLNTMENIIKAFLSGKVPFTGVGDDGLLYTGNENTQLTWMDAKVDGKPVTPRNGAPVEINALWYNALCFLKKEFNTFLDSDLKEMIKHQISLFEENFTKAFWNEANQSLNDVYRNVDDVDNSIRPNQLFAIGLPFTCVDSKRALLILKTVKRHLVTPYGLRTLSPQNPSYKTDYRGDPRQRDLAYHQGPVWPWLIGVFCDALLKNSKDKKQVKKYILDTFKDIWEVHLCEYGLFHISELFNPIQPHTAKGCIAQAWNIAELIRTLERLKTIKMQRES
ncbi:glycogen debranching enzyme N-terminal domain-containing protein [bacterium]|nr:glycogen debranching enzyme N-terminal domain-containing protein [bacterium]